MLRGISQHNSLATLFNQKPGKNPFEPDSKAYLAYSYQGQQPIYKYQSIETLLTFLTSVPDLKHIPNQHEACNTLAIMLVYELSKTISNRQNLQKIINLNNPFVLPEHLTLLKDVARTKLGFFNNSTNEPIRVNVTKEQEEILQGLDKYMNP